jgi:2-methylcitrate dehydratase PrpD
MTQVEALARYAARAKFDNLSAESRKQLPVHVLDSLGCSIAALGPTLFKPVASKLQSLAAPARPR